METEFNKPLLELKNLSTTSAPLEPTEQSSWKGLDPKTIGSIGQGIGIQQKLSKDPLKYLPKDSSEKPPLLQFTAISESQLIKESLFFTAYSKLAYTQSKDLLYKLYKTEGRLVRSIVEFSGFSYTDSHDWNLMWLGSIPQLYLYEGLNEYQRINHFPNSYEITKKDRMSFHLKHFQSKHGAEHYGFFPESFVIPEEYSEFYNKFTGDKTSQWIVKPCNSSQGKGIFILDNLHSLPTADGCVVSRYISNPLLINNLKFDLRIYVLITSYNPMRIYVYDEGLARFASEPYSASNRASRFSFLTNYSVNKKNEKFVQNSDSKQDNVGHKWSFSALIKFLNENSVDTASIVSKIYDIIIKSVISIEPSVVNLSRKLGLGRNNCFDLLGFDVLIDSDLKPWLLEVNLSPSLATDSPLDLFIKSNLISDTLNLVGLRFYDRKKECLSKLRARIRARNNALKQFDKNKKKETGKEPINFNKFKFSISDLVEEASRTGNFVRIFPTEGCDFYEKFFTVKRNSNRTLLSFVLLQSKEVASESLSSLREAGKEETKNKLMISGDDILIEYLSRVLHACKSITGEKLKNEWRLAIEKFVNHSVWAGISYLDTSGIPLLMKLEVRIVEMREKKKESGWKEMISCSQKHSIVRGFSALQLENMLKSSSKNLAKEVMSCLFIENTGILSEIIKWLASSSMKRGKKDRSKKSGSLAGGEICKGLKGKKEEKKNSRNYVNGSFGLKDLKTRVKKKLIRPKTCQESDNKSDDLE